MQVYAGFAYRVRLFSQGVIFCYSQLLFMSPRILQTSLDMLSNQKLRLNDMCISLFSVAMQVFL